MASGRPLVEATGRFWCLSESLGALAVKKAPKNSLRWAPGGPVGPPRNSPRGPSQGHPQNNIQHEHLKNCRKIMCSMSIDAARPQLGAHYKKMLRKTLPLLLILPLPFPLPLPLPLPQHLPLPMPLPRPCPCPAYAPAPTPAPAFVSAPAPAPVVTRVLSQGP